MSLTLYNYDSALFVQKWININSSTSFEEILRKWFEETLTWLEKGFRDKSKTHKLILHSFSYFTRFYLHRKHPSTLPFLDDAISTKRIILWLEAWFQNNALLKILMRLFVDKKCEKIGLNVKRVPYLNQCSISSSSRQQIRWLWNFIYVVNSCVFHVRDLILKVIQNFQDWKP